ncbi:alanyl-tRNA synthetase [Halodesulfurarchaeum formicicum]|uniref:Alanyl-tRNA synthetase n=1 Tax=Halodesulfurarchaeum formicicum TaxID=1873524 RepID=A0A1D8S337_9EURY|nr:alanine--tRNA ligase-related protein [Halodesulfurarchaeum formicicum]AOW79765.1 alanyl-tRNA synthetase [Halodesulfurarchaeum formicicum]
MAASRGPTEPEVRAFESTVESIDGTEVVLEETWFYPEGGGQPADRGAIEGVPVLDVQSVDDQVVHTLERAPDFEVGDTIGAVIDDEFRTYAMRAHTASHVLYGAGRQVFADIGYGGFGITDEKVRVDFETSTEIDDDTLVELERLTNRAIWDSREVTWEELPREEALKLDDIAFNTATEEGVMADADTVRVVTVEDWDVGACGGTHVSNTREIGPVSVLDRSNPGEGLTRVEFAVGPSAVEERATEHQAALQAANEIGTNITSLPQAVTRLQSDVESLEAEVETLTDTVLTAELRDLDAVGDWQVGVIDDHEANAVGDRVQELAGEVAPVLAATGGNGRPFVVVGTDGTADAAEIVDAVTEEFGGGGGGGPTFAQGGGLDADPADVKAFLVERAETGK